MKYIKTMRGANGDYSILTEDDMLKEFWADHNLDHNVDSFHLWMATHANPNYQTYPDYIPFNENGGDRPTGKDWIDNLRNLAVILDQMNSNLDDFGSEEDSIMTKAEEAEWVITFRRDGKEFSATIPWLAHPYEAMDTTIKELIEAELE